MPTLSLPLDILKPAHQILVEAINEENRTSLDYLEFEYTNPVPDSLINSDINTSIVLTPLTTSSYYNSAKVYYKRMDLAEIYATKQAEITVGSRTLLSEIIPDINTFYGINLRVEDYVEQTLPLPDPMHPDARLTVTLQANADSVLFYGSCNVVLNEAAPVQDTDNTERKYYMTVVIPGSVPEIANKIVCIKADMTEHSTFRALRNAVSVAEFNSQQLFSLSNGNIVARGTFVFDAILGAEPLTTYTSATVIMNDVGNVLKTGTAAQALFGAASISQWYSHWSVPFKYIIDTADTIGTDLITKVYRYDNDGVLDTSFVVTGITYVPSMIAVDKNNKIYTVSEQYDDAGVNKIRIDRLLPTGAIDLDFAGIILTKTGSGALHGVIDLTPVESGGFYLAIGTGTNLSSVTADNIPVVNGTPLVPGGELQVYAWNPVIKFKETGELDAGYKNRLLNSSPDSVFKPTASITNNCRVLAPRLNGVTFITNKTNPITGFEQRMPISFDDKGDLLTLSGLAYANQVRWESVTGVHYQTNGKTIVYGVGLTKLPAGGWSTQRQLAVLYLKSGEIDNIIYSSPEVAGSPAVINNFALYQKVL